MTEEDKTGRNLKQDSQSIMIAASRRTEERLTRVEAKIDLLINKLDSIGKKSNQKSKPEKEVTDDKG